MRAEQVNAVSGTSRMQELQWRVNVLLFNSSIRNEFVCEGNKSNEGRRERGGSEVNCSDHSNRRIG